MQIEAQALTLDRAELRAILTTASIDPCRVNLCTVLVDPRACVLVSTDGHRLTVAEAGGPRFPSASAVVLPAELLADVAKRAGAKDRISIAWTDVGAVVVTYGLGDDTGPLGPQTTTAGALSSATFPPWRAVFPAELHATRVPLTLNPYYLADALTALAKLQGKHAQVTCYGPAKGKAQRDHDADADAELSPVVFAGRDSDRGTMWRIVVMPVRSSGSIGNEWRIAPEKPAEPEGPASVADGAPSSVPADERPIGKRTRARKAAAPRTEVDETSHYRAS